MFKSIILTLGREGCQKVHLHAGYEAADIERIGGDAFHASRRGAGAVLDGRLLPEGDARPQLARPTCCGGEFSLASL